jgi:hypothetical protein
VDIEALAVLQPAVEFPQTQPSTNCYTATISFVVDDRGLPELAAAKVKTTNDQTYADAALATLARWHYKPALMDGQPVRMLMGQRFMTMTRAPGSSIVQPTC